MLEDDKWIDRDSKDQWVSLNARDTYHRVTEENGYRLSIIYHTPQHLHRLTPEDWKELRDSGFPVAAVWEMGLSFPDEDQDEEVQEACQAICESISMTPQITPGSENVMEENVQISTLPDSATMRPTLQAILWISETIANSKLKHKSVPFDGPRTDKMKISREMDKVRTLAKSITEESKETSLIVLHLAEILIAIIRLTTCLGMQGHLGLMLLHALETEELEDESGTGDPSYVGILRTISMIPTKLIWNWVPKIHHLTRVCPKPDQI